MAQFSYSDYLAQQAQRSANGESGNSQMNGPEVHFMGEFLKNDGDVAVVRFPYRSMDDINFETTHSLTFPGKRYPSRVRCIRENCPVCADGVKMDIRVFVKALVYAIDDSGQVKILNAVWDRPSAFADIDLKNLIQEYGDISQQLFKIRRTGTGTATRYTTSIVVNTSVYRPDIYTADFTELNKVDPAKILSKTLDQYNAAFSPDAGAKAAANTSPAVGTPTFNPEVAAPVTAPVAAQPPVPAAPVAQPAYQPDNHQYSTYQQPAEPVASPTAAPASSAPEQRAPRRYTF